MKKIKVLAVLLALICCSSVYAKDFDWSECWCNYGGGIEKGDVILNLDGGLYYTDLAYASRQNFWMVPPLMAELQFAAPIWKLPFTFGGYAGIRGYGYQYPGYSSSYFATFFGGEAAYHIMLPPEGLDVYVITRVGLSIPFVSNSNEWLSELFQFGEAIGASWYFGKNFGLNLEFGYPFSKFGVSFKF